MGSLRLDLERKNHPSERWEGSMIRRVDHVEGEMSVTMWVRSQDLEGSMLIQNDPRLHGASSFVRALTSLIALMILTSLT